MLAETKIWPLSSHVDQVTCVSKSGEDYHRKYEAAARNGFDAICHGQQWQYNPTIRIGYAPTPGSDL